MTDSYSKPCNPPVPREVRLHHDHKAEAISQRSRRGAEKRVFPSLHTAKDGQLVMLRS